MPEDAEISAELAEAVLGAVRTREPLEIQGGGSKAFYGRHPTGRPVTLIEHRGIVSYEPTELVLTARCGTPLTELEHLLARHGQMMAFEPPHFGANATLGGAVASGLSGPRRPYAGAARDFVLGTRVLNGKGEIVGFGGQVMKNVAGYDVSRLMAGAMGTLGILLEVSLKVLPLPPKEITLVFEMDTGRAIEAMSRWGAQPLPLSAACHDGRRLYLRLSGAKTGVATARETLGGEAVADDIWTPLREHGLEFFAGDGPLWRVSVPPGTPPMDLPGNWLLDWGGAQRWLRTHADERRIRQATAEAGGHATLFRGGDREGMIFHPLSQPLSLLHQRLKAAFDPEGIFNPGRMYPGL